MLVNTAAAKRTWSTRCSASACEETSIATADAPAAHISASSACRSSASGVVFPSGQGAWSRNDPPSVPITPHAIPEASSMSRTRWVVVVFPLVPVMPTMVSAADGRS